MTIEKTFDRADLVRFFYETGNDAVVGSFRVIKPSPTLFGETEVSVHPVEAQTMGFWCEKYRFAVIVRQIDFPEGGKRQLGDGHPLCRERDVQVKYGDGGSASALVRFVADLADEWKRENKIYVPAESIDLRKTVQGRDTTLAAPKHNVS